MWPILPGDSCTLVGKMTCPDSESLVASMYCRYHRIAGHPAWDEGQAR